MIALVLETPLILSVIFFGRPKDRPKNWLEDATSFE